LAQTWPNGKWRNLPLQAQGAMGAPARRVEIESRLVTASFSKRALRLLLEWMELHGEVFEPLRDPEVFAQVKINPETGTIEWPNGADLAPEFLHKQGTDAEQVA